MKKAVYAALFVLLLAGSAACRTTRHQISLPGISEEIRIRLQGSDGITQRVYWVDAVFYPQIRHATIRVDDKIYELVQYPTADGYGYCNAEVDLRGKGNEAELDFTDEGIRDLKLTLIVE